MLAFLEGIGTVLISAVNFVISLVEDLIYIIELVGSAILNLPQYFSWLPSEVSALLLLIFGIVVIYKIVGREG